MPKRIEECRISNHIHKGHEMNAVYLTWKSILMRELKNISEL